jgi:hypothetical protein
LHTSTTVKLEPPGLDGKYFELWKSPGKYFFNGGKNHVLALSESIPCCLEYLSVLKLLNYILIVLILNLQVMKESHAIQLKKLEETHDKEVVELRKRQDTQSREDMKVLSRKHKDKSELARCVGYSFNPCLPSYAI